MRQLSLRQLQRNFYKEIKDLPVVVVHKHDRHDKVGTPVFVIYPIEAPATTQQPTSLLQRLLHP